MEHPGETVRRGDIVATVDTSKAAIDIEVFDDGVVDDIVVPVGSHVPVGTVLAHITPSEAAAQASEQREEPQPKEVGRKRSDERKPRQRQPKHKAQTQRGCRT
jgi:pyruvate dehydrogenase E2 component (dihydrolipoamide acetyltransferase)